LKMQLTKKNVIFELAGFNLAVRYT
jgi:hypothetical protein